MNLNETRAKFAEICPNETVIEDFHDEKGNIYVSLFEYDENTRAKNPGKQFGYRAYDIDAEICITLCFGTDLKSIRKGYNKFKGTK